MTRQNISVCLPGCHGNQLCLQNIQIILRLLPFMLANEPQIFIKHSLLCSILAWKFLPLNLVLNRTFYRFPWKHWLNYCMTTLKVTLSTKA